MKYKEGDKVKLIRDDDYGQEYIDAIDSLPDRTATINQAMIIGTNDRYVMKEIDYYWHNCDIECRVAEPEPINNRFDILDIR